MEILISGASTGIGRACAVHMARKGHGVWAGVRSQADFDAVNKLNVRGLQPVFLDVTDPASVKACVSQLTKQAGILHGLVNNAGIAIGGPIEAVSIEDWRRQFETNVFGVVTLTQACLPLLRESKGRVVNISSISGRIAFPFMGPYAASKFALEAISDSLRRELRQFGVKVAVIEPGAISTPIWDKAKSDGLGKVNRYSRDLSQVYGRALERFQSVIEKSVSRAAPVSVVVRAVDHALTSRYPATRYPVGRGIRFSTAISRFVPDQWMDRLIR